MIKPLLFLMIAIISLSACATPTQDSDTLGVAYSEAGQQQMSAEEQAKTSFDRNDLSGCWQPVSIFPHSGLYGSPFILDKIQEHEYQTTQKDADGTLNTKRIVVSDDSFEYILNNGTPQKGKLLFDTYPYQLQIITEESPDAFEVAQQDGFQWLGKTCPQ